ncbi:MAG: hypothetical protein ACFFA8_00190 [Promethearchaeota archaeon]
MAQVELRKVEPKKCVDIELIKLDELPVPEVIEEKEEEIIKKKGLKGIINKFRNHAKYHEEFINIEKVKRQLIYRNFGVN